MARKIAGAPALKNHIVEEYVPGSHYQSDAELLEAARQHSQTIYHPTSTCKMGRDEFAVVDARLRIHGIEKLRIADASIMPEIVSVNTNAPTIMIGEKGADMILQDNQSGGYWRRTKTWATRTSPYSCWFNLENAVASRKSVPARFRAAILTFWQIGYGSGDIGVIDYIKPADTSVSARLAITRVVRIIGKRLYCLYRWKFH